MNDKELEKKIDDRVKKILPEITRRTYFTEKKITDTPTDALQVVNRKYVTLNGTSASRPTSSVMGQQYFDTTLASGRGKPVWWNGTGFVDAAGTYV